ncbi:MAG: hypothetical protein JO345_20640 [Streptosporangiaceae bacterium]|nr:hypothetical protein [Streptosporangiaceae bacterium]
MSALQVHDAGRGAQYRLEQVTFDGGERGTGHRLGEHIVVLAHVLDRCRLPDDPVRPRHGIHDAMLTLASPAGNRVAVGQKAASGSESFSTACLLRRHELPRRGSPWLVRGWL